MEGIVGDDISTLNNISGPSYVEMHPTQLQSMFHDQTSVTANIENLTQLKPPSDQQAPPFSQYLWKTQTNQTLSDLKSLLSSWGLVELYDWFLGWYLCYITLL